MPKKRINVYIDGFNLYHSTLQHTHPDCRWLNLLELSKQYIKIIAATNRPELLDEAIKETGKV